MSKLLLPRGFRNAEILNSKLHSQKEEYWIKRGENRALKLFYQMTEKVPAYKDFLKSKKFSPKSVNSIKDFHRIPPIDKNNYLRKYPKDMLCWEGDFPSGQWVISTTSGSTGEPYYFPREHSQDWQYAITAELYLRNNFKIQDHRTLYIVAFPMGAWIGGLFTYEALKIVAANNGYDLSIITPGIHKQEVISAVKQLSSSYDKIIIGAYAPFLKDILDDGKKAGINWAKLDLGFVFSAEAYTEKFRDYVAKSANLSNIYSDTLNHYGTVDLGTMSHETPESVLIRRKLVEKDSLFKLFGESKRQPTLTQYIPELFYFESQDNNLFCSAYSGIPLIRYDLKDYGDIVTKSDMKEKLYEVGIDIDLLMKEEGISELSWNLPYVYVFERNDFSVSYYAFLIYPDTIRRALQNGKLPEYLTGKFSMLVDYDESGRQRLNIHVELSDGREATSSLKRSVSNTINIFLENESSEYRETSSIVGKDVEPDIYYHEYEDPEYFKPGTKQKWVKK